MNKNHCICDDIVSPCFYSSLQATARTTHLEHGRYSAKTLTLRMFTFGSRFEEPCNYYQPFFTSQRLSKLKERGVLISGYLTDKWTRY